MKYSISLKKVSKTVFLPAFFFVLSLPALAQTRVDTTGGDFSQLKTWAIKIFSGLIALWFVYMIGTGIFKLSSEDHGGRGKTQIVVGVVGLILWKLTDTFLIQLAQ
jgi:hypothetical protein